MKRKIIASILGAAASSAMVASSYGQGTIFFANYEPGDTGSPSAPVTFGNGPAAGEAVNSAFTAELLYQYVGMSGGIAGPVAGFDVAQSSLGAAGTAAILNPTVAPITQAFNVNTASFPQGYLGLYSYTDPNNSSTAVVIPGYASGTVTFEVYVSGTFNSAFYSGASSPFTQATLATAANQLSTGDLFNVGTGSTALTPMTVATVVPEPTTIALAGLGMASLLAMRRRK